MIKKREKTEHSYMEPSSKKIMKELLLYAAQEKMNSRFSMKKITMNLLEEFSNSQRGSTLWTMVICQE